MNAVDPSHELAVFLRARRERLKPADANLPESGRARRTPGLRREEVAELAGVSVDYVVRLEQGRGLRPSPDVLDALARALRLSEDERAYLFDLAQHRPTPPSRPRRRSADDPGPMAQLVCDLSPLPAMVVNHRSDLLAWNPEMSALMLDFQNLPEGRRNTIWMCVMHPELREFYLDRERTIREGIANLRAAWAAHPDDNAFAALVDELTAGSAEFARLWALRDVRIQGRGHKRMCHPRVGPVAVNYEVLIPAQEPDQRLVIYRAADPQSQLALDALAREANRPQLRAL